MNSPAAVLQGQPGVLRKLCRIKGCVELRPIERLLCDHHETMVPDQLARKIAAANRRFGDASVAGDIGRAMRALEEGLMAERLICREIEKCEADGTQTTARSDEAEGYSLTRIQTQCLGLIEQGIENGICPTYQELAQAMGVKSLGRIHELVVALEMRRRIRKLPAHPRSIVVLIPLTNQERKACHPSLKL